MSKKPQVAAQVTVLGPGSALQGTIRTRGPLQVQGAVCGSLRCEGQMSVSESGQILGEVHAHSLSLRGRLHGMAFVRHHLQVRERGLLAGYARYESLEISRGGVVEGSTHRMQGVPTLVEDSDDDDDEYVAAQ